jgi:subtilisin family serine protease
MRLSADLAHDLGYSGTGVTVALLDTGIDDRLCRPRNRPAARCSARRPLRSSVPAERALVIDADPGGDRLAAHASPGGTDRQRQPRGGHPVERQLLGADARRTACTRVLPGDDRSRRRLRAHLGAVTAPDVCRDAHPIADEVACWSNASSQLDLLAPGAPIETTGLGGATATFAGTSAASAVAAGGAALLLQASPGLTADALEALLEQTGVPLSDPRRRAPISRVDLASALSRVLGRSLTAPRPPRVDISQ